MGGIIYSPYTGECFDSTDETDIEHIVARSEAHDSGLCDADVDAETRDAFASDLLNLTLASPDLNRQEKVAKDAAEWLPEINKCWFAYRVVQVRAKYSLTVDQAEADTLEAVLSECSSFEMVVVDPETEQPTLTPTSEPESTPTPEASPVATATPEATPTATATPEIDALATYDDDGSGMISCAEARAHGIAPVHSNHPAYPYMNDADGDGVVCE
ncbi:MAG: excalibur calcium-binding domain-containing protein [Chloroflexi bacterium]|nr:excalibur calcium-binding domain-containing protein [Chloroflexota bacterium]